jgi:hypothetical protein
MRLIPRSLHGSGDDLQLAAAHGTMFKVAQRNPLEQPGPVKANRLAVCAALLSCCGPQHAILLI